jgi:hypothetical protein
MSGKAFLFLHDLFLVFSTVLLPGIKNSKALPSMIRLLLFLAWFSLQCAYALQQCLLSSAALL